MEARGEGLILKHPDGEYVLNGRNKDWIKVRWNIPYLWDSRLFFSFQGKTRIYGRFYRVLVELRRKFTVIT